MSWMPWAVQSSGSNAQPWFIELLQGGGSTTALLPSQQLFLSLKGFI